MATYFLLGIVVLIGLVLFGRWYVSAEPGTALKALKWIGIALFVAIAGFFLLTGRLAWVFMALPVLFPWFMRARAVARAAKAFSRMSQSGTGGNSGETSEVETRFFKMALDHDSGTMDGDVLEGTYEGRTLSSLNVHELLEILQECQRDDQESARLLEAYLDRNHPDWHDMASTQSRSAPPHQTGSMDRSEAYQVLGLEEGATEKQIKDAHRKLIAGMHPDHGGSDYLAAKINQAKDVLLGE